MQGRVDVLVVDDSDEDARDTLLGARRALTNPAITRMKDGEVALQFVLRTGLFKDRPEGLPRLILIELDLPVVRGFELLTELRRESTTREIPIVVLTRNDNPIAIENAYALGASAYLTKPRDRGEYVSEVARLVTRWLHLGSHQAKQ